VLQGERAMAKDNITLGKFHLMGIPPAPRGVPQIEVAFDIDSNGILNVSAKDLGTGKQQAITITSSMKMDEADVKRKIRESEQYAEEDKKRKELIDMKNQGESIIYQTERLMNENADKIDSALKDKIDSKLQALRGAVQGNDANRTKQAIDDLNNTMHELSQRMYQTQSQNPYQQNCQGSCQQDYQNQSGAYTADDEYARQANATKADDVVDADYEVY